MNRIVFLIILIGVIFLIGIFYYLYSTYPNSPEIIIQEEGYKVSVFIKFPEQMIPVAIYRNNVLIGSVQSEGKHFIEYLPPNEYNYEFHYISKNLFGIKKDKRQSKQLVIMELSKNELSRYFDFPSVNLTSNRYGVYMFYDDIGGFLTLDVRKNNKHIRTITQKSLEEEFLEYSPPGKHVYEILFDSDEFSNLSGFLKQDYEINIKPILPVILSLQATPLFQGYSSDFTATVKDASACKADLLLYPPSEFERSNPTVLKSYEFNIGEGLDYFFQYDEQWSLKEILFPEPTDASTARYSIDLKLTCFDYYRSTSTEEIGRLLTSKDIIPTSITIGYHKKETGIIYAEVISNIWVDLNCEILIGNEANYTLDKQTFLLQGRHVYEFDIGQYNSNLLYVTAICQDSKGNALTKISEFRNY